MKKVFMIVSVAVLAVSLGIAVFADNNLFLDSPSRNKAIELAEAYDEVGPIESIILAPYNNRGILEESDKGEVEDAYKKIAEAENFNEIIDLSDKAKEKSVGINDLAVSDLFSLVFSGTTGEVTIVLRSDVANGFFSLIYLTNGEWNEVKQVSLSGEKITFSPEVDAAPYAIVVNTNAVSPQTGESNTTTLIFAGIAAVCACGIVLLLAVKKKVHA